MWSSYWCPSLGQTQSLTPITCWDKAIWVRVHKTQSLAPLCLPLPHLCCLNPTQTCHSPTEAIGKPKMEMMLCSHRHHSLWAPSFPKTRSPEIFLCFICTQSFVLYWEASPAFRFKKNVLRTIQNDALPWHCSSHSWNHVAHKLLLTQVIVHSSVGLPKVTWFKGDCHLASEQNSFQEWE